MSVASYDVTVMPPRITVRKATPKDYALLKEIKTEFYNWECDHDERLDPTYAERVLGSRLARNLRQNNTAFFLAFKEDAVIGYAGAEVKESPIFVKARRQGHLFNLYVRPGHRSEGAGSKLLAAAHDWFRQQRVDEIILEPYAFNTKAQKFYARHGYKEYMVTFVKKT